MISSRLLPLCVPLKPSEAFSSRHCLRRGAHDLADRNPVALEGPRPADLAAPAGWAAWVVSAPSLGQSSSVWLQVLRSSERVQDLRR